MTMIRRDATTLVWEFNARAEEIMATNQVPAYLAKAAAGGSVIDRFARGT